MKFCWFLFLIFSASATAHRSLYGQECNKILRCERRAWLSCVNGQCVCVKDDEMTFIPETGKCAAKSGERCKYFIEHSDGTKSFEMLDCVPNATCDDDGFCKCTEDYFENSTNGTCSPQKTFGETCDSLMTCSDTLGLECLNGTCGCNERVSKFQASFQQCIGLAGEKCVNGKCDAFSECEDGVCECVNGYFLDTGSRSCVRRYEIFRGCDMDRQCRNEGGFPLKCIKGSCQCDPQNSIHGTASRSIKKHHSYTSYHGWISGSSESQCLGRVDFACIEGRCAAGAYCRYHQGDPSNLSGTCNCLSYLEKSRDGTCGSRFEGSCDRSTPCIGSLACVNYYRSQDERTRLCRCPYEQQEFSAREKTCISSVGAHCKLDRDCVTNAVCEHLPRTSEHGLCKCQLGFIVNAGGKCDREYLTNCSYTNECDSIANLVCKDGKCDCRNLGTYSEALRTCLGRVGTRCDRAEIRDEKIASSQCVENAFCRKSHPSLLWGHCACRDGFAVTGNYTCDLPLPTGTMPILEFPPVYDEDDESDVDKENEMVVSL